MHSILIFHIAILLSTNLQYVQGISNSLSFRDILHQRHEVVECKSHHEEVEEKQLSKTSSNCNRQEKEDNDRIQQGDDIHVDELYMKQRLDHFSSRPHENSSNDDDVEFFSQRYFHRQLETNDYHVNSLRGSSHEIVHNHNFEKNRHEQNTTFVFLCVGGEGPSLTKRVLIDSVHCTGDMIELASKLFNDSISGDGSASGRIRPINIHLFALEHRYYGKSYPLFPHEQSSVSNSNLQYLSSRQALADIANFIEFINTEYQVDKENVKWISFGGSYPGMLAAWSRLKFPHLIHAAVSNSAPVQTVLDFQDYNNVVASALKNEMVGGSDTCHDIVVDGHEQIVSILTQDANSDGGREREMIASMFNICGGEESLLDEKNVNVFLGDGVIFVPAQANDPSCGGDHCNIEKICNFMTAPSNSTSMGLLADMAKLQRDSSEQCVDINWNNMIEFLSSDAAKKDGTRSWLWQTCTEMGFYQTCTTDSLCPYGKGFHTVDQDLEMCERAFGISREFVPRNVEETLTYYGGWDMQGNRILSVNGDVDPWSALSMNIGGNANSTDLPTYWSLGSSHHFWTHQSTETDDQKVVAAREMIHSWVINLLYNDDDNTEHHSSSLMSEKL